MKAPHQLPSPCRLRDLDERKGKLPCCQKVTDIQTSVEKWVKFLLLGTEKNVLSTKQPL